MKIFIPDKFAKAVKLMVKITGGICTLADGNPLPELKPNASAELVISPWDVVDDKVRDLLLAERTVEFLPAKTAVWARIKEDKISEELSAHRQNMKAWPAQPGCFVEIMLQSSVSVVIRGDQRASLTDCECCIPSLPKLECSSINEAYTRVSEAFEPSRRSHTGNVFSCVFYEAGNYLYPLGKLRDEKVAATPTVPSI